MAKVILTAPDGQELEIEGPTQEGAIEKAKQLSDRLKQAFAQRGQGIPEVIAPKPQGAPVSGSEALNRQGLETAISNFSGLADLILNPQTRFGPQEFTTRSGAPVRAVETVPTPSGEQVVAGAEAGLGATGALLRGQEPMLGERFQQSLERGQQAEEQRPGFTQAGGVLGDALTLATGRAPFAGRIGKAERSLMATRGSEELAKLSPGIQREVQKFLNSSKFRTVLRGSGRAAETGAEGALLALMKDGDPVTTAAFAAGGQVGGSVIQTLAKGAFEQIPGPPLFKLAAGGVTAGVLFQMIKSATPGGEDRLLESLETSIDKTTIAIVLGALAGSAGTARMRGEGFAESFPKFTDALMTIPRGSLVSIAEDYASADAPKRSEMEAVINKVNTDPGYFNESARKRLQRVFTEKKGSLSKTIDSLKKDPDFKLRLEALTREEVPANPS